VGIIAAPAFGNDEGLVEEMAEQDDQGGNASHAVEIGSRRELGWSNLVPGMSSLKIAGNEKPSAANETDSPRG
jgi:hypothetical protein